MEEAVDHLIDAWQEDPSEPNTVALCKALNGSGQVSAIQDLGSDASTRHPQSTEVLLAVGRMYLSAALLADAQVVLVAAGKLAPKSTEVYRWLGEVLLRRGDAARAEKVLERALALGRTDGATRFWHSRARSLLAVQQQRGERGVAEEVARASLASIPGAYADDEPSDSSSLSSLGDDESTVVQSMSLPDDPDLLAMPAPDDSTLVQHRVPEASPDSTASTPPTPQASPSPPDASVEAGRAAPSATSPSPVESSATPSFASPSFTRDAAPPVRTPPTASAGLPLGQVARSPVAVSAASPPPVISPPVPTAAPSSGGGALPSLGAALPPISRPPAAAAPVPDLPGGPAPMGSAPLASAPLASTPLASPPLASAPLGSALPPVRSRPPPGPSPSSRSAYPPPPSLAPNGAGAPSHPPAPSHAPPLGSVLPPVRSRPPPSSFAPVPTTPAFVERASLAPPGSFAPQSKARPRRAGKVIGLSLLVIGAAGAIAFFQINAAKAKRSANASALAIEAEHLMANGRPSDFIDAESSLSRAFELSPEDPRTALAWARERVLRATFIDPATPGIDTAIARAEQAGVPAADLAFAKAALSFIAGKDDEAIEILRPGGGTSPESEAFTHWIRGVALDRTGQVRATDELQAAAELLAPARILHALRSILIADPGSKDAIAAARSKLGDRADTAALVALAWIMGPGDAAPPEVEATRSRRGDLPLALRFVPDALDTAEASNKRAFSAARGPLAKTAASVSTSGAAVLVGRLALAARDEKVAHDMSDKGKASIDPAGRALFGLVALLDGRLDDAAAAATAGASDASAIRAALAYERLDAPALAKETAGLKWGTTLTELFRGLETGPVRIKSLDDPRTVFGECFAADAALDAGNIQLARDIIDSWAAPKTTEAHALRVARLLRYTDRASEAESTTRPYADTKPTPRFVIERTLELVQAKKGDDAKTFLAKNGSILGDSAAWANAYVEASRGHETDAEHALGKRDPPSDAAPLPLRVLAAFTYAALGDKKSGGPLVKKLEKSVPHHPDLVAINKLLDSGGIKPPEPSSAKPKHGH